MGCLSPREFREHKVRYFLICKHNSLGVHECSLKFSQLSRFSLEVVADMRSKMNLFVAGLSYLSSKKGKTAMLIGDMDIARLIVYVQPVQEEKLRDSVKFINNKSKTSGKDSGKQNNNVNRPFFQQKHKEPAPSSTSTLAQRKNVRIIVKIHRISELDLLSLRVVWNV